MKKINGTQRLSEKEVATIFGGLTPMMIVNPNQQDLTLPIIELGDPSDWDQFPDGSLINLF